MPNIFIPTEIFVPEFYAIQDVLDQHERAHWLHEDANLHDDATQWKRGDIKESEKAYIKNVLRLFTQADTDICSLYVNRLLPVFQQADARMMLLSFANREVTHIKAYKKLNEVLGYDSEEFMGEFLNYSQMKDKHVFMLEDADFTTVSGIALYLAKQILMEGVNLFASFAMLLSWSQSGKLPGCVFINKWSIADESLHVKGLVLLFEQVLKQHPEIINDGFKAKIYEAARTIVRLEDDFVDLCYQTGTNPNLTAQETKQYIRYVCDYRMQQMGLKSQFGVATNPIPWFDLVATNTFGNFFETTIVEYSKGSIVGNWVY